MAMEMHVEQQAFCSRCVFGRKLKNSAMIGNKSILDFKTFATSAKSIEQVQQDTSIYDTEEDLERVVSYLFRAEVGGLVKVFVGVGSIKCSVFIEVSSLPNFTSDHKLALCWGIFRSDSSCFLLPDLESLAPETSQLADESQLGSFKTPFVQNSSGIYTVNLEFDCAQVPFYLTFALLSPSVAAACDLEIRTHRKTNFCVPVGIGRGYPLPLGVSVSDDNLVNFSLFSRSAEGVVLCLYDGSTNQPALEIDLDPYVNRTGDIWHISMERTKEYVSYGYRCKGSVQLDSGSRFHMRQVLLDPYAKRIGKLSPEKDQSVSSVNYLGCLDEEPAFDWNDDIHPMLPMEKLAVYRLNIGNFTKDKSSGLPKNVAGTFSGVIHKLQHIKSLGFNAILLEPVFPFDEQKGPYYPYHFFSAMNSYGCKNNHGLVDNSMKEMIKTLHENGIEVLLEVVFSHTSEGGDAACQAASFRGIDNSSYYIVDGDIGSGTNNALKCNSPVVQQMILDSLRHLVTDFHIDGFCFINASHLLRGVNGEYLSRPPLVEAIAFDPLLSKTKIIADCWSPLDMSCIKIDFPHWKKWAEMNASFCADVRNFMRGEGVLSDLATRLCGSGDIFSDSRGPAFSFNFIARNSGLSLVDLVSFSDDSLSSELSWNCGKEGPTNVSLVLETRLKQIRNFLFILFVSLGVPVLNMGDEFGYSVGGSPLYADRKPINWGYLETGFGSQIMQFITYLNSLRTRRSDLFQKKDFLKVENINWHGSGQSPPKWHDPSCKTLAMTLKTEKDETPSSSSNGDMFISFNASDVPDILVLPEVSEATIWHRLVDTALIFPGFFSNISDPDCHMVAGSSKYTMEPHSCALFEAREQESVLLANEI
ncbi:hypothetical protein J5N97_015109 [Dioscorea zingiberensis]|uniref:Glycosyl hydrolase family 13 catalytic domain-containing protein n=1 Tax=Dioscorea zingiberensis TaxID=325984 RepID=A0A9D5HK53_9LILI|nr:hypothetical protein J5N97_015109 [Dioscorea zingiberensis]